MLAIDAAALARFVIGATRVAPHARAPGVGRKLDPPPRPPIGKGYGVSGSATAAPSPRVEKNRSDFKALSNM
jgi:hypothetical protein